MSFNWRQPLRSFVQQVAQKVEQMEPQPEYIDAVVREYLTEEGAQVGYNVTNGNLAVNLTGVNTPSSDVSSIGGNPIVPDSVAANSVTNSMLDSRNRFTVNNAWVTLEPFQTVEGYRLWRAEISACEDCSYSIYRVGKGRCRVEYIGGASINCATNAYLFIAPASSFAFTRHYDDNTNVVEFDILTETFLYVTTRNDGVDRNISVLYRPYFWDARNDIEVVAHDNLRRLTCGFDVRNRQGYVKSTDGEYSYVNGFTYSNYVDVSGVKRFVMVAPVLSSSTTKAGVAFYDRDNEYISGIAYEVNANDTTSKLQLFDVPDGAVYMRCCARDTEVLSTVPMVDEITANRIVNETKFSELYAKANANVNIAGLSMFKRIGVIGDSISVGCALDSNGNDSRRNTDISWPQQMARELGCTAYNLGASGVDPIEWFDPDYEFAEYCYTLYQSTGECDLYIVALGLNQGTLGSVSDINQSDYTQNGATFYGQYARIIQTINHDYPNAKVMCFTEPTTRISSYDTAVRNICALEYINAELVDLENDYISLFNTDEIVAQKQPDGLHYTPYGYSLLANATLIAVNDYISKNPANFKYVGVAEV